MLAQLVGNVRQRNLQPEIMDDPDLDPAQHQRALSGLGRLNFFSGSSRIVWKPIARLARRSGLSAVRVADVACGGGDVAVALWHRARRAGLKLELVGYDISGVALDYARQRAAHAKADIHFVRHDALNQPIPPCDVATSSLFLHHLDQDAARTLLRNLAAAAERLVVINDLERTASGFLLAKLACHLFSRSPVVHVDGPRSVEGAFTTAEARALCAEADLADPQIARHWPCRYSITWERNHA